MSETPSLFDEYNQPNDATDENPPARPADIVRQQLSDEAKAERARQEEVRQRRLEQQIRARQAQIKRAAEQGIDLRTIEEINQDKKEQRLKEIRALREKLQENNS